MLLEREASDMPRVWRKDMDHSLLKWERQAQCCLGYVVSTLLVLALVLECEGTALGQNASAPTAGDERIIIVMSDGTSSVHRLGDQRLKVRTAAGESEVPLRKIVYIYRGKARLHSEQGVISGEVEGDFIPVVLDDGSTKQIPVSDLLFLGPVRGEIAGKIITRLEIIVADGKVTKHIFTSSPSSSPLRTEIFILDEYSADRLFTVTDPAHKSSVSKATQEAFPSPMFPGNLPSMPPFGVEFDVTRHGQAQFRPVVCLGFRASQGNKPMYGCSLQSLSATDQFPEGQKKRLGTEFSFLGGLGGTGEFYLYLVAAEEKDGTPVEVEMSPGSGFPQIRFYRTISNVLRLPVRFE